MVAYQPPDGVQLMIGACHRAEPLIAAAKRLLDLVFDEKKKHVELGLAADFDEEIEELVADLGRYLKDPAVAKNDTPLQMREVAETMARTREWMLELRMMAAIELSLDAPALGRVFGPFPELRDAYPRDVLAELDQRLGAASDLRARLEDLGLDERFVGRGRELRKQLATAIGKEDLSSKDLQMKHTRHYMKKGRLHMLLKRLVRQGQYLHRADPDRAAEYHLDELEAVPKKAATPEFVRPPRMI